MPAKNFYLQLSFLSAFTALLIIGSRQMESLQSFSDLAWISLGLFVALSAAIYHIGYRAAKSPDKTLFTTVVMGFTMLKMMLALMYGMMPSANTLKRDSAPPLNMLNRFRMPPDCCLNSSAIWFGSIPGTGM